jgi:integrase
MLHKHLCSRIGHIPLQKLTAAHLQAVYAEMAKAELADRTRLHLHRITRRMLKHAVQWGVVARNVSDMVDAPRVRTDEVQILAPGEVQAVLETLRDKPLYPIAALGLASGLRRSELLALRWQDVELDAGHLQVARSLEETKRGGLVFKTPKTRNSRRVVTLPASTIVMLREHRRAQQEQHLFLGLGRIQPAALVFSNVDGGPRSPRGLSQQWGEAMKAAGFTVTFHSLRHTHASTLIASGLDILSLSRRLGHASASITLNVYGHLYRPDTRAAAIMEQALQGME